MKPKLLREGGVTETSLKNDQRLTKRLGPPVRIELHRDPNGSEWYVVRAMYDSGDTHDFTGFAWGYDGEGPQGLREFCARHGLYPRIPTQDRKGLVWAWPEEE